MSKSKQKYYRIDTGKLEGVYELAEMDAVRTDKKERVLCPCCDKPLKPHCDVIQWGFWQDIYTTFFVCKPCCKAWRYSYIVVCEVTQVKTEALDSLETGAQATA